MAAIEFSYKGRSLALEKAAENLLDLLVVGGGITGAGIAREAALQGLKTLVIDKGDFASGTSSRSSKLIHGGLRYLAQGDISLVREAARERAVLRSLAPHLALPLPMLMPLSSLAGRLKMSAGLWTFMQLAGGHDEHGYEILGRGDALEAEAGLRRERLSGAARFTEFLTDDARLTLETLESAAAAGALVASYTELVGVEHSGETLRLSLVDRSCDSSMELRCRCLVNAAGPWFEAVRGLYQSDADSMLQLSRGIHIVVEREKLPVDHIVVLKSPDGRSTFVVPRGRHVYIGTTDTFYAGEAEEPGVDDDDVAYLLESAAATFEQSPGREDIVGVWSGVRPLVAEEGKKPSEVSRRDEVLAGPGPIVAIVGGKLTTFRCMAERVLREVLTILGRSPDKSIDSARLPLAGGDAVAQSKARAACLSIGEPVLEDRLWSTYGVAAAGIIEAMRREPASMEAVGALCDLTVAELDFSVANEMVMTLDDLLRRRCRSAMFDGSATLAAAPEAARLLAERLNWDDARREREIEAFESLIAKELNAARA